MSDPEKSRQDKSLWQRLRRAIDGTGRRNIIGLVEGARRGQFCGWAYDSRRPSRRLTIEIITDSQRWIVAADRYRADVHQSHPDSDGYCGFSIPATRLGSWRFAKVLCSGSNVALRTLANDGRMRAGTPLQFGDHLALLDTDLLEIGISGWIRNIAAADWRGTVAVIRDGSVVASCAATLYREDSRVPTHDGFHGFSFPPFVDARGTWALVELASGIELPIRHGAVP